MRLAMLALVLAAAGCSSLQSPQPFAGLPRTPETLACEREAERAPDVQDLVMKQLGNPSNIGENQGALADARRQATLSCLRTRGLAAPGGVEAPRRERSLFEGLGI